MVHVLDVEAIFDLARHDLADGRIVTAPFRDGPDRDVAVRDCADEVVIVADGHKADILRPHAAGDTFIA